MQANSSEGELLSTTSKFMKRKKILSLLVYVFHHLELTTGIVKREIKHFHVVVVVVTAKKCTKKRELNLESEMWKIQIQKIVENLLDWTSNCTWI